jgi:hypothetical protein
VTVYHGEERWDVEILEVSNVSTERRPFHTRMTVNGKAKVTMEESEPMIFNFEYTGSPNEDKERIINYIRGMALDMWLDKKRKNENTLQSYIRKLVDK